MTLEIAVDLCMTISFAGLTILVWRVGKRPRWRIRAVVYGWGLFVVWAFVWCLVLPMMLRGKVDRHTLATAFPEGT
jgi:hypothetical protein